MLKNKSQVMLMLLLMVLAGCAPATPAAPQSTPSFDTLIPHAAAFVDQLAQGDYSAAFTRFDGTMKLALPEAKLKATWEQLLAQVGAFQKQVGTRTADSQGYRIVFITCQFEKSTLDVQVVFNNQSQISGLFFKPTATGTPQPTLTPGAAFTEYSVTIGAGDWSLPGVLTLPAGSGPFPAVVLVHGSGPNDRDETIGPNKVFRDLAWGLASQGVAALRYDKRTYVYANRYAANPALLANFTIQDEVIDDALEAVKVLQQTVNIDPSRIFVAGHSLGGTLAPRIAQQQPSVAGIIILAGTPRPLEDLMVEQYTYIFNLDGTLTPAEKSQIETVKTQVAKVKDPNLSPQTPESDLLGASGAYWLSLRAYQPGETARSLPQPILVLQGERDYQVLASKDFTAWKTALAGKSDVTFKSYPTLNHLFISGEGPSQPSEYEKPGRVSDEVIVDIAAWIQRIK